MSTPVGVHKESYYQAKIIKWLREAYPQAFVWKAQQGPYSRQGIPDICAIMTATSSDSRLSARRAVSFRQFRPRPSSRSTPPEARPSWSASRPRRRRR